ncbi:hypothetical protein E4U31_000414 [Claviceps sp. LM219 group G6]|nr:hypothetical protein E4U15_007011 [Claviceps sp. LM218 group G6]KAG6087609.1 hypothetical protein E4U31_000414 [Claviceps sp. LM219 group G6]
MNSGSHFTDISSLNSRFTEVQFCAKSDTNGGIKQKRNVSTRILDPDQLSGLSDDVLDPLSSLQMGNEIQGIHSVVGMHVITTHGDRCMLARAGAGQSDMTASTEYSVGHSVWM